MSYRSVVFSLLLLLVSSAGAPGQEEERAVIERRTRHIGVRRYRAGEWGVAGVTLLNRSEQPMTVLTGVSFSGDPMTRFSRRFDVPARSMRLTHVPILATAREDGKLEWNAFLYRLDDDGTPVMMHAADDYIVDAESLPESQAPLTVTINDQNAPDDIIKRDNEFAVVMRLAAGNTRAIGQLDAVDIPAFDRSLDAADQIMLAGNQLSESPAGLAALRSWLQRGGQLWIRLDRVDLSTVERLLGDSVRITEVDRTSLTEFQIWNRRRNRNSGEPRQFDYPVELVRVIAEDVDVIHEIAGWPISFMSRVGEGRVMFTTLSDDGWIRRRRPQEHVDDVMRNSEYIAEQALAELTDTFTGVLDPAPLTSEDFEPFLSANVGYRIPGRATVLSILGLFCVCLIGGGLWLQRSPREPAGTTRSDSDRDSARRLEWLAVLGPLFACVASVPLVLLGQSARQAVPAIASMAEFVRVGPGSNAVQSTGAVAIYVPDGLTSDLNVTRSRLVMPKPGRMEGEVRQMVRTDLDDWYWDDFSLTSGLQFVETAQTRELASPIRAIAAFGPDGLTGRLESDGFTNPDGVLIASTAQRVLAATIDADGRFTATRDGQLGAGVYVQGTLLNDQQRLRRDLLSRLLQSNGEYRYPLQPTLLAWTTPQDHDIAFPDELEQKRTSLLAVPLEFQPPPPGTPVFIPASLMTFDSRPVADGQKSTAYDSRAREWIKTSYRTDALLRFQIPRSVLPLDVEHAKLEMRLKAPGRTMTVSSGAISKGGVTDAMVLLKSVPAPSGAYEFLLDDPAMLATDDSGGLHVLIRVGDVMQDEPQIVGDVNMDQSWKMEFVQLELTGRTMVRSINKKEE